MSAGDAGDAGDRSLDGTFFDDFYREQGEDPWGFTDRWYEQRKRAVTLASLPRQRFRRALEVGCSIGVLTSELAPRCDELLALDVAAAAVALARERTRPLSSVRVEQMTVPAQWPPGRFDLVVLSEIGYYLSLDELTSLCEKVIGSLSPDGVLVACHWRHPVQDYPLRGDTVHAMLRTRTEVASLARHEEEDFLLDVLVRPPAVSVAGQTGLLR